MIESGLQTRGSQQGNRTQNSLYINRNGKSMFNNFRCICLAIPWGEPRPSTNFHSCHVTCDIQNNLGTSMTPKKQKLRLCSRV